MFAIWVSLQVFCPTTYTGKVRILIVTSLLPIVLVCREGSHWYILPSRSFWDYVSPYSTRVRKCWITYKLLWVWGIPIHSHWNLAYLSLTSFIGGFCLALVSARLFMTLASFWICLSSHGVMTLVFWLQGWNTSSTGLGEKISYPHPTSRSCLNI